MDKSPRSLRKLPARSAKSAERRSRLSKETDVPTTNTASPIIYRRSRREVEHKLINIKKTSPPRRSRSRSNARKKTEPVKYTQQIEVKKETASIEKYGTRSSTRAAAAPVSSIVSKLKEGLERKYLNYLCQNEGTIFYLLICNNDCNT